METTVGFMNAAELLFLVYLTVYYEFSTRLTENVFDRKKIGPNSMKISLFLKFFIKLSQNRINATILTAKWKYQSHRANLI